MTYSADQRAQFRAAFASLSVVGPSWILPSLEIAKRPEPVPKGKRGSARYRMLTAFDKTQPLHLWATESNQKPGVIAQRIDRSKWSVEEAITGGRK